MGNANGREEGEGGGDISRKSMVGFMNSEEEVEDPYFVESSISHSHSHSHSPPHNPTPSPSPLLFSPQLPVAPLQPGDAHLFFNQESYGVFDYPPPKGIPTLITWSLGGHTVAVQGSWDNWTSRMVLQRSGKDHTLLLVLPSGIYHYRFIVDGDNRYMPDLPHLSTDMGFVCNVLDVHDYVPESLESVAEFEAPASPGSSYGNVMPGEDDFGKEPVMAPPQLHLTVLGMPNTEEEEEVPTRPQHVVLNHLFIEKGLVAPQSVVALGLTHRFQSKYVTVVLYKPLRSGQKHG